VAATGTSLAAISTNINGFEVTVAHRGATRSLEPDHRCL
jgi:hypothetical protein